MPVGQPCHITPDKTSRGPKRGHGGGSRLQLRTASCNTRSITTPTSPPCQQGCWLHLALLIFMRASSAVYFSGTPDDTSSWSFWALICNAEGYSTHGQDVFDSDLWATCMWSCTVGSLQKQTVCDSSGNNKSFGGSGIPFLVLPSPSFVAGVSSCPPPGMPASQPVLPPYGPGSDPTGHACMPPTAAAEPWSIAHKQHTSAHNQTGLPRVPCGQNGWCAAAVWSGTNHSTG